MRRKIKNIRKKKEVGILQALFFLKNTTVTVNQEGDQKAVEEPVSDKSP